MLHITKYKIKYKLIIFLLITCTIYSCIEPFEAETKTFESVLVIEARLTNEVKYHEIELNRTYTFEENKPVAELNAVVKIIDDQQNEFQFIQNSQGKYVSIDKFGAVSDRSYQLSVITNDGKQYSSELISLPESNLTNNLTFNKETNQQNVEGIAMYMDSFDELENSGYYRFEFEETYKIIPPYWSEYELIPYPSVRDSVTLVLKTREDRVCYNTVKFNDINIKNTNDFGENRINPFLVRFVERDNFIMAQRYSMLVKQFALSREAYTFYETLKNFSESEGIFSENQPGFIYGNIVSQENSQEKVIGFFDVSKVYSKRIFFNYYDFYLGELRPFIQECIISAPSENPPLEEDSLWTLLITGKVIYASENDTDVQPGEGPYYVVPPICGDCTLLGTTMVPEFWEE